MLTDAGVWLAHPRMPWEDLGSALQGVKTARSVRGSEINTGPRVAYHSQAIFKIETSGLWVSPVESKVL